MTNSRDKHETVPFPVIRLPAIDIMRQTRRMHTVHGLMEADVTRARQLIRENKAKTGEPLSFTAFLTACLARAVDENKYLQAYRKGNKLVLFDDVDVCVIMERELGGHKAPVFPHVIRATNKKTISEIHEEIRAAQRNEAEKSGREKEIQRYALMPRFIRRLFWKMILGNPYRRKKVLGTVGISAVGMFVKGAGWGIPIPACTLTITVGGIAEKPGVVQGRIDIREYLSITITIDHDIIDGVPAAQFTKRFTELIEQGYGLRD